MRIVFFSFFFFNFIYLFIYFWLCWVFVSVQGLSLVAASGGHSSSRCAGLSLLRPLSLWSTGSGRAGSVIVAHGPSCSVACGIFPDQGSNLCPLHWQADSQPLSHQGSPRIVFWELYFNVKKFAWCPHNFIYWPTNSYYELKNTFWFVLIFKRKSQKSVYLKSIYISIIYHVSMNEASSLKTLGPVIWGF